MKTVLGLLLVAAVIFDELHTVKGIYEFEWTTDETNFHDRIEEFTGRNRRASPVSTKNPPDNVTLDHHTYYTSQFFENGEEHWTELKGKNNSVEHSTLSSHGFLAVQHYLKFNFPYYGHILSSIFITTGGFLYLGEPSTLMTKVQFIAPLMAYFNPKLNETASVYYYDDGQKFIVQWDNVLLHNQTDVGPFTFQVTLHKNGKIVFAYKTLPESAAEIPQTDIHPVRVGVSDAFSVSITYRGTNYRVYYIYDEVHFNKSKIVTGTALVLNPKPNCVAATSCASCIHTSETTEFACGWCPKLDRCSDGFDRKRFEWRTSGCSSGALTELGSCDVAQTTKLPEIETQRPCSRYRSCGVTQSTKLPVIETQRPCGRFDSCKMPAARSGEDSSTAVSVGGIVGICIVLVVSVGLAVWFFYAYRHPTTQSGLFLIWATRQPRNIFKRSTEANAQPTGEYKTQV